MPEQPPHPADSDIPDHERAEQIPLGPGFSWFSANRLIFIANIALYLVVSLAGGTFPDTDLDVLIAYGAKESSLIAMGEWWRLIAPLFLHNGLLHLGFNSMALYVFGPMMENTLGTWRFVLVYLTAGIMGVLASAVWSVSISVGASGSIFGLLGVGFFIERRMAQMKKAEGEKPDPNDNTFTSLLVANGALALFVDQFDHAAHVGGLITGIGWVAVFYFYRRLRLASLAITAVLVAMLGLGFYLATDRSYVSGLYAKAAAEREQPQVKLYLLSKGLWLTPSDDELRLKRLYNGVLSGSERAIERDLAVLPATAWPQLLELKERLKQVATPDLVSQFELHLRRFSQQHNLNGEPS